MRIGIFAKTFPGTSPPEVLRQCANAGFEGVQYNMACSGLASMPDVIPPAAVQAILSGSAEAGQQLFAVSATYNMVHPDPAVGLAGVRRLRGMAAACRTMGVPLLTLCTGTRDAADQWRHHPDNASPAAWGDLLSSFEVAVEIAEAHGIALGVEPELANVVSSAEAAGRLIDEMKSDAIRIILDPANLFEQSEPVERRNLVERAVGRLAGRIAMAHAKDRAADGGVAAAGQGVIDFSHFFSCLTAAGFDGPVVANVCRAEEAAEVARFLKRQREAMSA